MKQRPETIDEMMVELFKALKNDNELHLIYIEARLHREADWIIPGTIRG